MMRHNTTHRLLAMLLSLMLVIGMLPTTAWASGNVAYINTTGYATLNEAVSAASPGDTILLTADDNTAQRIEINKNLTIELDGHNLPGTVFKISTGTVTIGDRKGTGTINGNHAAGFVATENTRCSSSIYITGTADVTLNNLRVEQCGQDDLEKAIFLGGSASLTVNGGIYTGPKDPGVDAIFYYNNDTASSLTINDGYFEANCALSVDKTPGTGGGTLVIRKATFVGNGTAFWIEEEYGGVTTQEGAERFLANSSGSHIIGTFDQANIVIGSGLFVSDGFTGPEYGSTDSDNPAELTPEDGDSITLLPQILGGDGSGYTYTWYKDGVAIPGATGASYPIEGYQSPEDDGIYSVTVSQGSSSITLYWQVSAAVLAPQLPGAGTEQSPYEISTPEQLMAFAQLVNGGSSAAYAKLTDDIDMSGQSWTGISINDSYTGVFDGAGHTISNLTGTEGLFANNAGTIKNVRLENVDITREGGNLGAVAGVNTGTVFNCISSGSIKGTGENSYSIGGLIGHNNGGLLSGSSSSCTVAGKTAGGLTGSNYTDTEPGGQITACIYTGTAKEPVEADYAYSESTNVYYKAENGGWKSYPGHAAADEGTLLEIVNRYITEEGGIFILNGNGTAAPINAVSYLDYTENGFSIKYIDIETCTVISGENPQTQWNSGWYVVDGQVVINSRVQVSGDVKLILKNGADLTVNGGVDVSGGSSSFTVYAQSMNESVMGSLTATAAKDTGNAGIGSSNGQTAGAITVNGGKISATGGSRSETDFLPGDPSPEDKVYTGAGIGGGEKSACSMITINGGIVTANPGQGSDFWETSNSAGIGNGGYDSSDMSFEDPAGTITINGGSVNATGVWWGAGIGGGDDMPIASITINGGIVRSESDRSAGIGNGRAGDGGSVTINGGTVHAASEFACGIGGGYISDIEQVVITGGDITAASDSGAGIGSCAFRTTAKVTISGGRVTATSSAGDGIGIGDTFDDPIEFSTGESGTAVIIASSIGDDSGRNEWSGLIFEGGEGKIYGGSYTVEEDLTIPEGETLTIEKGKTLAVSNGATITNNGAIHLNDGGTYSGDPPKGNAIEYQIQWDTDGDGIMDDTTYVAYDGMPTHEAGSKSADAQYTYTFTGWSPKLAKVTEPAQYTAEFSISINQYTVTLPSGKGYTVTSNESTTVDYGAEFTFTITVKDGYSKTDEFAVKANGEALTAQDDGSYAVTVKGDTDITVEGVADTTAPSNIRVSYGTDYFKEFLNTATFGLFFKDTVTVTISAVDEGSGVKEISYRLGDGELQTAEAQNGSVFFHIQPEFKGNINNVTAEDNAGNTSESIDYEYFAVEQSEPSNVTVDTNGYESGKWTNGDVTITVSGSTATSGIAKYQYSTDGGRNWHDMTATEKTDATAADPLNVTKAQLTVSESGTADYIFRAVSNAENESAASAAVTVKIDKTTPAITLNGDTESYLQEDTAEIIPTVVYSGISKVEVQKGNGNWETINPSADNPDIYYYTVTENGTYTFRVTNMAGTTVTDSITYDKIDSVKPVLVIDSGEYTDGTWTNEDVTLSVSNTAGNLGATTVRYKVDGGAWQNCADDITVSEETEGTRYTFKARSASGVESDEVSITVKLDKTVPDGDIKIDENSVKTFINVVTFGLFYNENVDVTISGSDALSGVGSILYYASEDILTEEQVEALTDEDWTEYTTGTLGVTAVDAEKFIYYVKVTDNAGNSTCFASNGVTFDLTAPAIFGVTDGETYYTTQTVQVTDDNLDTVTLNGETAGSEITLAGNVDTDTEYTIVATDKVRNTTTVTVTMKPTAGLGDAVEGIEPGNVSSSDKEVIEDYLDDLNTRLEDENLTDAEKEVIRDLIDDAQALLDNIDEAEQAANTENIQQAQDITPDNVKPDDKEILEAAKEDIKQALENYAGNYTEDEKTQLENTLEQIEEAIEVIQRVEDVEEAIGGLPESVSPDDTKAAEQINTAREQYDALSEREQSLISNEAIDKLNTLLAQLGDYRIIEGDGSTWTKESAEGLTIVANGAYSKYTGIEIDGNAVSSENYTAESGSTVITLKPNYLNTLTAGEHTIIVLYTDGEAQGTFIIAEKPAEPADITGSVDDEDTGSPQTGEDSHIVPWIMLMLMSGGALFLTLTAKRRNRKGMSKQL